MKDILARSPNLDDIIRKAANHLGENHGLTRDAHGMRVDNEGNTSRYVGSHGQHPSKSSQPQTSVRQGWYKTLNEGEGHPGQTCAQAHSDMDHDDWLDQNPQMVMDLEEDCLEEDCGGEHYEDEEEEIEEVTGASSAGSYEAPLFGPMTESERILKSVIREEISEKISKQQLKESLKNRITRNILSERDATGWSDFKDYNTGKFKYEKPTKLPGEIKSIPGMKQTDSILKKSKSENTKYLKHFDKKIKEYLDFENNSHPEFPHQNNSKTDYKSPMYRNTSEDEEFIEDFRGMGLEDANGVDMLDRIEDYLSGAQETGNAQTDKDGKALGNVVPNKVGDRVLKKVKRKNKEIAKRKSKMTNLHGYTPDVQTTTTVKESYLLTEKRKWWKILCCIPIALPFTWRCCVDFVKGEKSRVASPSDLPPFNSPLSDAEMKKIKPHIQTNSLESLPRDIQELFKKIQPSAMAYAEELKNARPVGPMGPGEIKPPTKVDGILQEEVNKMKHLFNYTDTTQ